MSFYLHAIRIWKLKWNGFNFPINLWDVCIPFIAQIWRKLKEKLYFLTGRYEYYFYRAFIRDSFPLQPEKLLFFTINIKSVELASVWDNFSLKYSYYSRSLSATALLILNLNGSPFYHHNFSWKNRKNEKKILKSPLAKEKTKTYLLIKIKFISTRLESPTWD